MKKTSKETYELKPSEIAQALAEWVNLHSCGESHLDEDKIHVEWNLIPKVGLKPEMTGVTIISHQ